MRPTRMLANRSFIQVIAPLAMACVLFGAAPALAQSDDRTDTAPADDAAQTQPDGSAPADATANAPNAAEATPVAIVAVEGLVQVRADADAAWREAKPGMNLGLGAEFRTGPRSAVRFRVGESQTVALDRLGVIKVLEYLRESDKIETDLGMEYGRSELQIKAGGVEHESRIESPGATLAVRGSEGGLSDNAAYPALAYCRDDESFFKARGAGRFQRLDESDSMESDDRNPADRRYTVGTYNPRRASTTEDENRLLSAFPAGTQQLQQTGTDSLQDTQVAMQQQMDFDPPASFEDIGIDGDIRAQLVWQSSSHIDLAVTHDDAVEVLSTDPPEVTFPDNTATPADVSTVVYSDGQNQATGTFSDPNFGDRIDVEPDKRVENIAINADTGAVPSGDYDFFVENFTEGASGSTAGTLTVQAGDNIEQIDFLLLEAQNSRPIIVTVPGDSIRVGN